MTQSEPEPYVLNEVHLSRLTLHLASEDYYDATHLLHNGRANYILFENFIADRLGLLPGSQGAASDLVSKSRLGYEVKSYRDPETFPNDKALFHTAASSTFSPNNKGPVVKGFLDVGDYGSALALCKETGYDKNDFYVYVNSAQFKIEIPLRFIIIPTRDVLQLLSPKDPRLISKRDILGMARRTEVL